jgi:hypothetical protein
MSDSLIAKPAADIVLRRTQRGAATLVSERGTFSTFERRLLAMLTGHTPLDMLMQLRQVDCATGQEAAQRLLDDGLAEVAPQAV